MIIIAALKTVVKQRSLFAAVMLFFIQACNRDTNADKQRIEPLAKKILATVNGREITLDEFEQKLGLVIQYEGSSLEPSRLKDIKVGLLNELIEEGLILMEAAKKGLRVDEDEVKEEAEAVKNGYTHEEFEAMVLKKHETIEHWQEGIRRNLLIKKVMDQVTKDITISGQEARAYYKQNIKNYATPEMVRARMIIVTSEEKAREALTRLKKEGFDSVARSLSEGPEAQNGGDLGVFSRGQMPAEFEDAVFSLEPKKISPVIKTVYGYHIFLIEEKKKKRWLAYDEVKEVIMKKLKQEKKEVSFEKWIALEKKEALIEVAGGLL